MRFCIGVNVCILLYLGAQYFHQPRTNAESQSPTVLELKKRTLHSVVENQTLNPSNEKTVNPIQCMEKDLRPKKAMRGQYWVFYNYVPAQLHFNCNATITYTTHCDHTFLDNLEPLLKRWQGPVSIALYTPGSDYEDALKAMSYYRYIFLLIVFLVLEITATFISQALCSGVRTHPQLCHVPSILPLQAPH